jgi:hypothetical protein
MLWFVGKMRAAVFQLRDLGIRTGDLGISDQDTSISACRPRCRPSAIRRRPALPEWRESNRGRFRQRAVRSAVNWLLGKSKFTG